VARNYLSHFISLHAISGAVITPDQIITKATEIGFVWSPGDALLTFATSAEFVNEAASKANVAAILVDSDVVLNNLIQSSLPEIFVIKNARLNFFRLHNSLRSDMKFAKTQIDKSAEIHPTALISESGVEIGARCVIEPGVTI
jgi:UDP-3-O-[3-hydroxymyristoyl] glucosamine N-acyltransferase